MNAVTTADLVGAIARQPHLPIIFETSDGARRYILDPEAAPYTHDGYLIVPIADEEA